VLLVALLTEAPAARAEVSCLTDDEIRILVRTVYTRVIGRVLRICADHHRALDDRAIRAATDLLTTYGEQMRLNRTAANELMARIYENWEEALAQLVARATAGDEAWARAAGEQECVDEIVRVEEMVALDDYERVMTTPRTERQFETERALVAKCE
jgi:hypothetical protein